MKPEEQARLKIDSKLEQVGWVIQDKNDLDRFASEGVICREFRTQDGKFADYAIYLNGKLVGIIEAKKAGTTLSSVHHQSAHYAHHLSHFPFLRFIYESNGEEIYFRDLHEEDFRSREIGFFHSPSSLFSLSQSQPLRNLLKTMPELENTHLRECQFHAIKNLESSLASNHPKSLLQMATGSGKTYTACNISYRLLKHAKAKRILFLVDRGALGNQTKAEYDNFKIHNRPFSELYHTAHITSNAIDPSADVYIMTIQRLYSILSNKECQESDEDLSPERTILSKIEPIAYNQIIPFDFFDFIIVDECHRSIYGNWRAILDYFDSFIIGLTATPSKLTLGFFAQNLIYTYSYEQSVLDGVNVDFLVWKIESKITQDGGIIPAKQLTIKRDKRSREKIYEELDQDLEYSSKELDSKVINPSQIRTILQEYKRLIYSDLFSERKSGDSDYDERFIPKTLIFAKDDHHAEEITKIAREVFGKGNEFAQKITYRTSDYDDPKELIKKFRQNPNFRIAITVDMIATGTDIKPLEVLIFMRNVKSQIYFEQMKGRGCRSISDDALLEVTPNAKSKNRFYIIDAVGVMESKKSLNAPINPKKNIALRTLLDKIAQGEITQESTQALSAKLSRIALKLQDNDKKHADYIDELISSTPTPKYLENTPLEIQINGEQHRFSPSSNLLELAKNLYTLSEILDDENPNENPAHLHDLCNLITLPLSSPTIRQNLIDAGKKLYIYIDEYNLDEILTSSPTQAQKGIEDFEDFLHTHRDEITAISILYHKSNKHLTKALLDELYQKLQENHLNPDSLWKAYAQSHKVQGNYHKLTDIIELVRFGLRQSAELMPFGVRANRLYELYLGRLKNQGIHLNDEQKTLLRQIKDYIINDGYPSKQDIGYYFSDEGGISYTNRVLGETLNLTQCLDELYEALVG